MKNHLTNHIYTSSINSTQKYGKSIRILLIDIFPKPTLATVEIEIKNLMLLSSLILCAVFHTEISSLAIVMRWSCLSVDPLVDPYPRKYDKICEDTQEVHLFIDRITGSRIQCRTTKLKNAAT